MMDAIYVALAGSVFFAVWLYVLLDIMGGAFLDMWCAKEGRQKRLPAIRLLWFLLVFVTFVGAGVYLRWKKKQVAHISGGAHLDDNLDVLVFFGLCVFAHFWLPEIFWFFFIAYVTGLIGASFPFGALPPFGIYNPVYGGFFFPLIRHHLPALKGLSKDQRQKRFSALHAAARREYPFVQRHGVLSGFMLGMVCYPLVKRIADWLDWRLAWNAGEEFIPDYDVGLLVIGLVLFKVFIWDAAMALLLYHLMKRKAPLPCAQTGDMEMKRG